MGSETWGLLMLAPRGTLVPRFRRLWVIKRGSGDPLAAAAGDGDENDKVLRNQVIDNLCEKW